MFQTERTGQENIGRPTGECTTLSALGRNHESQFSGRSNNGGRGSGFRARGEQNPARLHPDTLARYEAITSYCGEVDPASAPQYAAKLNGLTQGWSANEIAAKRASGGYRDAMAQADDTLSQASHTTALNGCTEFLAEK